MIERRAIFTSTRTLPWQVLAKLERVESNGFRCKLFQLTVVHEVHLTDPGNLADGPMQTLK